MQNINHQNKEDFLTLLKKYKQFLQKTKKWKKQKNLRVQLGKMLMKKKLNENNLSMNDLKKCDDLDNWREVN